MLMNDGTSMDPAASCRYQCGVLLKWCVRWVENEAHQKERCEMNVIWIVADTFRRDHLGCYQGGSSFTPWLDGLAATGTRFDSHYAGSFPTMPARADFFSGRWTMSYMKWQPLPPDFTTVAQILSGEGVNTAAVVDTPFFLRDGMNYDRGFDTFHQIVGQERSSTKSARRGHEARDIRSSWVFESHRNAPRTFIRAMEWLELNDESPFFLYVDTWDPHEPWDAPEYYTRKHHPGYDGELVYPVYGPWHQAPGMSAERMEVAHATYKGEVSMVDTWVGRFLNHVENIGLSEETAIIFTTDHGIYFGEHGGLFGKMSFATKADGTLYGQGEPGAMWGHSPLYEEIVRLPLVVRVPGANTRVVSELTSAIDLMPTVLDLFGVEIPSWVEGRTLLRALRLGSSSSKRDLVMSSLPFADAGEDVFSVDHVKRPLVAPTATTISTPEWSFIYSSEPELSELFSLVEDPSQERNVIGENEDIARTIHSEWVDLLMATNVPERLVATRRELCL